jgi:hypothetical protein
MVHQDSLIHALEFQEGKFISLRAFGIAVGKQFLKNLNFFFSFEVIYF